MTKGFAARTVFNHAQFQSQKERAAAPAKDVCQARKGIVLDVLWTGRCSRHQSVCLSARRFVLFNCYFITGDQLESSFSVCFSFSRWSCFTSTISTPVEVCPSLFSPYLHRCEVFFSLLFFFCFWSPTVFFDYLNVNPSSKFNTVQRVSLMMSDRKGRIFLLQWDFHTKRRDLNEQLNTFIVGQVTHPR